MRLMGKLGLLAAICLASTGAVSAEEAVTTETATLGTSAITLHLHPFLTEEELTVLRLVLVNEDALKMFVVSNSGHAALAVAPEEGFVRDGALVPSAKALADLPDLETARTDALKSCDEARTGDAACVVVLEIAPAGGNTKGALRGVTNRPLFLMSGLTHIKALEQAGCQNRCNRQGDPDDL